MGGRRWDVDERRHGVASGQVFAPNLGELADAMRDPGWATEEPELHLLPHIEEACDQPGAPFRIVSARSEGEVFIVELEPSDEEWSAGSLRRAAVALIGSFAEPSTHIREHGRKDVVEFDVATGTLASETGFIPHGHLVRLRILR